MNSSENETRTNAILGAYSALIAGTAALLAAMLLARVILNFRNRFLFHVDGVWLTCAFDFVHGVLYRPLFGPLGYGGTRYFPLYFVTTGACSKIFGSLETCGLALSVASVISLSCACYVLLRRLHVSVLLSLAAVAALNAVETTQQALLGVRGDGMAAMLSLWGLVLCIGPKPKRALVLLSAVFFALAFATKLTSVTAFLAVILAWACSRRYKEAAQLGLATCGGYVLVLLAIYFGSHGRALEIFRACAGGGGSLFLALEAPYHMLIGILPSDPVILLSLVPAAALALSSFKNSKETEILPAYFLLTLPVTVMIFGSPGISTNHLIDLQAAAVMLIAVSISRHPAIAEVSVGILALGLLVACGSTLQDLHTDLSRRSFRADARQVFERLPPDSRPVLAENPLVVLQSGKTPYVLDPFMFRVITRKNAAFGNDLWEKIAHKDFSAIILEFDPKAYPWWYRDTHFGEEFLPYLDANYSFNFSVGKLYVYTPK